MRASRPGAGLIPTAVVLLSGLVLLVAPAALGARLVWGARQTAIRRAFDATAPHRAR